ncbi:MAG: aldehyde ferredoxin oxidoreductase N-terminal domain-containing protein, partial [Thermoplasmatales archaeon]
MEGNWNKFVNVNLETGEIWEESLSEDEWERWIGGVGIGVHLFSKIFKGNDPLSPDNPIIIATGPLVGTPFPNSGRH